MERLISSRSRSRPSRPRHPAPQRRRGISVADVVRAIIVAYAIGYIVLAITHPELLW